MSGRDLPQGTADDSTLTFAEGVEDITDLLEDPASGPDLGHDDQDHEADADWQPGDAPGPDDAEADAEDDEQDDGPDDVGADGDFVSKDAKVRLDDGTVITVGELARNNLFQRDYTRKTEELKAEKQELLAGKEMVGEYAQAVAAQRNFLLQISQQYLPQAPNEAMLDPNSAHYNPTGYAHAKAQFEQAHSVLAQLQQAQAAEMQWLSEEQAVQQHALVHDEAHRLMHAVPEFRDRKVYEQFWSDANEVMASEYGFSPEELALTVDHRFYKPMRDLVRFHKARRNSPRVRAEMERRPQFMKGGQRMDPKSKISREARTRQERLRKSGSFQAGIAALMDLDL